MLKQIDDHTLQLMNTLRDEVQKLRAKEPRPRIFPNSFRSEVIALCLGGISSAVVARHIGIGKKTVDSWLAHQCQRQEKITSQPAPRRVVVVSNDADSNPCARREGELETSRTDGLRIAARVQAEFSLARCLNILRDFLREVR